MAKSGARSPHPDPLPEGEGEDQRGDAATAAWLMTAAGVRARAHQILALAGDRLAVGMQVAPDNPLVGIEGRVLLLRRLGDALAAQPELFGADGRIGGLFDHLRAQAMDGKLPASAILAALLRGFGAIWPGRHSLGGVNLGDVWQHRVGLVPFHQPSQLLAYSLIEPLAAAGVTVTEVDGLTGLAEYRNGGLFLDLGVIAPRDPGLASRALSLDAEPGGEWRALTLALLDPAAP